MDIWLIAAGFLIIGLILCGIVIASAPLMDRLVALEMASVVSILILMLLAQSYKQPSFHDLAITLSLLSLPSGLVFVFFFERWL